MRALVSLWHGVYLFDGERLVREERSPASSEELTDRARLRADGRLTREEEAVLGSRGAEPWQTRDRRLAGTGVDYSPSARGDAGGSLDRRLHHAALVAAAEQALSTSWDSSIHVEEAVRATRDLERASNLIGERLTSWASRDAPEVDTSDPTRAASALIESAATTAYSPDDPKLGDARRSLARAYLALRDTRAQLAEAVASTVPRRTPNLHRLLGSDLAAKLVAQAGGLERLARLPSSTVQVLGAERAFFEHLRGRAPPPRHGLLFLHPAIQSAPRAQRGKLARSLAGAVSIAARLDHAGTPVDPDLKERFERRREAIRAAKPKGGPPRRRPGSRAPLDAAAQHRPVRRGHR